MKERLIEVITMPFIFVIGVVSLILLFIALLLLEMVQLTIVIPAGYYIVTGKSYSDSLEGLRQIFI